MANKRILSLIVAMGLSLAGLALLSPTATAAACATPSTLFKQPVDAGTLKVARIAGSNAGNADAWDARYDAWFCNPTGGTITVTSVKIEHRNGSTLVRSKTLTPTNNVIPANTDSQMVSVRDTAQYPFPLPQYVRYIFTVKNAGGTTILTSTNQHLVAEHVNPGPLKGYLAPFRQSGLGTNQYWYQARHAEPNYQRWAYDLTVQRWTGSAWTHLKAGAPSGTTDKTQSLTFGQNLYAVADGEIIGCNRGAPDNNSDQKIGNVPGGNLIWLRVGDETVLYAHLKQNSIPQALCPFSDDAEHKLGDPTQNLAGDAAYMVKAGQFLGQAGNSGFSRGGHSHLHIHVFRGLPKIWGGSETGDDADSRPMRWINTRVQSATKSNVDNAKWNRLGSSKQLPYNTRIQGNWCSENPSLYAGKKDVLRRNVLGQCFQDMFNAMVQAGFRPTSIDVFNYGSGQSRSNTVWRPNDGTQWVMLAGLTPAGLQAQHDKYVKNGGYRYLQLESYREGSAPRFAVIFVKAPGPTQYARANLTGSAFQKVFDERKALGFRPVSISVAVVNGTRYYTGLWAKANVGSFIAKSGIATSAYQTEFNTQARAGRKLVYVDGYRFNGKAYLSAIWWGAGLAPTARHGQTAAQVTLTASQEMAAGRYTRRVTGYEESGIKFAGIWRAAPTTTITSGPSGNTTSTTASFSFTSSDPLARFECGIVGRGLLYGSCTSPKLYTGLSKATRTFRVRAQDAEGIRDATPATRTWTVV